MAPSYVLYWMQAAQRARGNAALERAIAEANRRGVSVVVCFALVPDYPEATPRHYRFMLGGLRETAATLAARGMRFVLRRGQPAEVVPALAREACSLVMDVGYTRIQRAWREAVAARVACPSEEVETEVIVPTAVVSPKQEWSAATLRRKITPLLPDFLSPLAEERPRHRLAPDEVPAGEAIPEDSELPADSAAAHFRGGAKEAERLLEEFLATRLARYAEERSDPALPATSRLSPYLHFGQISALEVALRALEAGGRLGASAFLEELIVRRELSANYVLHNPRYDAWEGLPAWSRATLAEHASDAREEQYDLERLEAAETGDRYWNAAMRQMRVTGWMHNTMRMYWGKRILAWTASPEEAWERTLTLNNRWLLDGRDPNSYAGVGWIFGLHDRPWPSRPVFGSVRCMTAGGLRRGRDLESYVRQMGEL